MGNGDDGFTYGEVNVYIPKFKLESKLDLVEPMQKVGVTDMFSNKADFSGMISKANIHVSVIKQKAFIEVNEEGTELLQQQGWAWEPFLCLLNQRPSKPTGRFSSSSGKVPQGWFCSQDVWLTQAKNDDLTEKDKIPPQNKNRVTVTSLLICVSFNNQVNHFFAFCT